MNLLTLANQLQSGAITLAEWQAQMREYLRGEYVLAMELAKNGRNNVTFSDWGFVGSELKKQYQYLDRFAKDIAENPQKWLSGTMLYERMKLYSDSAYTALADMIEREMEKAGYTEEKNILGDADHCDECLQETAKGWSPIGSLIPIGDRICIVKCKCTMQYRKQMPDGSYQYE